KLLMWIEKPQQVIQNETKYLIVSIGLAALSTLSALFYIIHASSQNWYVYLLALVLVLLVNHMLLRRVSPLAEEIIDNTHENIVILGGYKSLIIKIESEEFHSKILLRLQSVLNQNSYSAAREIDRLKRILEVF